MARDPKHYPSARLRAARRAIVADLYRRGHSYGAIQARLREEDGMERTSLSTIHSDVMALLAEWRAERLESIEDYVTLELRRIDDATRALWAEWEKSKEEGARPAAVGYMAEIRQQLAERRKLLGLYAPERREVAGPGGGAIAVQTLSDADIAAEIARITSGLPPAKDEAADASADIEEDMEEDWAAEDVEEEEEEAEDAEEDCAAEDVEGKGIEEEEDMEGDAGEESTEGLA